MYNIIQNVISYSITPNRLPLQNYLSTLDLNVLRKITALMYIGRDNLHVPENCSAIEPSDLYLAGVHANSIDECINILTSKQNALQQYLEAVTTASRHLSIDLNSYT